MMKIKLEETRTLIRQYVYIYIFKSYHRHALSSHCEDYIIEKLGLYGFPSQRTLFVIFLFTEFCSFSSIIIRLYIFISG